MIGKELNLPHNIPNELLRHCVWGSWVKKSGRIADKAFQLRPSEKYLSFVMSNEIDNSKKMIEAAVFLKSINYQVDNGDRFLFTKTEVVNELNITRKLIEFRHEYLLKYGMYYLSNDPMDILEAKTKLCSLSYYDNFVCNILEKEDT